MNALLATDLLDSVPEASFDRWTRQAAGLLKAELAFVNLLDESRQFSKRGTVPAGWPDGRNAPLEDSICRWCVSTGEPLAVEDTRTDSRFSSSVFVREHGLTAYLGMPVRSGSGHVVGTLCVAERAPRCWTPADHSLLRDLAAGVSTEIGLRAEIRTRAAAEARLAESEERFRQMAESIPQEFWMADPQFTRGLYASPAHEAIWRQPVETWLGDPLSILSVVHPDDRQVLVDAIHAQAAVDGIEYRIVRPDGEQRWLMSRGFPIRDAEGRLYRVAGITEDVTARKEAEEAIRTAMEAAERANQAKSQFLSRMSHELRTPLNAILGFGQLLEADVTTPEDRESVEQILRAGRHLLELINEVLDLARVEAGAVNVHVETVSVTQVVREAMDLIRPLADRRGIRVDAALPAALGHVLADPQRLKQVLLNFLSNAIKYNHEGGAVMVRCLDAGNERLRVEVADTGPGIGADERDKLFVPFERLGAERLGVEGAGLGLALCRALAELMGGEVGVRSLVGDGSTFWIELPRAPGAAADDDQAPEAPADLRTILYVEDNLSNLRLVERVLAARPGIRLLPAMLGRLGVELAREHRPDLILLDMQLPDMHGIDVLRRLRETPELRDTHVVVVSADAVPARLREVEALGPRAVITKPLHVRELLRVVDEALAAPRADGTGG